VNDAGRADSVGGYYGFGERLIQDANAGDDRRDYSSARRLVFIGQGSGYFPYPASSFMVNAKEWIYYGGGIAVVGLLLIILARR
jgi:hypothetical protein